MSWGFFPVDGDEAREAASLAIGLTLRIKIHEIKMRLHWLHIRRANGLRGATPFVCTNPNEKARAKEREMSVRRCEVMLMARDKGLGNMTAFLSIGAAATSIDDDDAMVDEGPAASGRSSFEDGRMGLSSFAPSEGMTGMASEASDWTERGGVARGMAREGVGASGG